MSEIWWKLHSHILSTNHHLLQLQPLHWGIFYFVLDTNSVRPFSLKRLRSSSLNSFGVWMGILLHMVSNILNLQSPARHYLVNNSPVTVLLSSFIILKKRILVQNRAGKNPTSDRFLSLSWGCCLPNITCVYARNSILTLDNMSWWHLFCILTLCKIQIECLWTLTPKAEWNFARTCNGCS